MPRKPEWKTTGQTNSQSALTRMYGSAALSKLTSGYSPMQWNIKVKGVKLVNKKFKKVSKKTSRRMLDYTRKAVILLKVTARDLILHGYYRPAYQTGKMYNSVTGKIISYRKNRSVEGAVGVPNVYYAILVHEGTDKMTKRPFLKDAFIKRKDEIEKELRQALEKDYRGI